MTQNINSFKLDPDYDKIFTAGLLLFAITLMSIGIITFQNNMLYVGIGLLALTGVHCLDGYYNRWKQ